MSMNLGQRIKQLRLRQKLSLKELSDKLNELYPNEDGSKPFGKGKISKWEGSKVDPAFSSVAKLAKYFNISLDYLAGHEPIKNVQVEEISVYKEYKNTGNNEILGLRYLSTYSTYAKDDLFYLEINNITYLINKDIEFKNGNTGLFKIPNTEKTVIRKGQFFEDSILLTDENEKQNLYKISEVDIIGVVFSKEIKMI